MSQEKLATRRLERLIRIDAEDDQTVVATLTDRFGHELEIVLPRALAADLSQYLRAWIVMSSEPGSLTPKHEPLARLGTPIQGVSSAPFR